MTDTGIDASPSESPNDTESGSEITGDPMNLVGLVSLNEVANLSGESTGRVIGSFVRLDKPRSRDDALELLLPEIDTCTVNRQSISDITENGGAAIGTGGAQADDAEPLETLSAGDSLVFTSAEGTWLTVPRSDVEGFISYASAGDEVPLPAPETLVVDVPGDDFPAFAAAKVPVVPSLTGVTPERLERVTDDTVFRWDAAPANETWEVSIDVLAVDPSSVDTVSVNCRVLDDGEFQLSDAIDTTFGEGFVGVAVLIRQGVEVVQQGDALLVVTGASVDTTAN